MSKQRFYIATSGNDDNAYKEAMQFACKLANEDSAIKRVVILVPAKQNTDWFRRLYGPEIVKKLFEGAKFENCNPIYKLETKTNYKDSHSPSEIVISCAIDDADLLKIDDFHSVKAIIAIPWLANGINNWVQTWSPTELRGNQQSIVQYPEPSCIVKKAMGELTATINMSTGLSHPTDEKLAKTYILALHKYEPSLDAQIVYAHLVKELNWESGTAKVIQNLIEKLNSGKHFQGGERQGLEHYYAQWKSEC